MAAEELARPGVEVIQEFRTVSPVVITPQLVPCVVGVAKQIVEVLVSDGAGGSALNPDALITLPALAVAKEATGNPLRYTGLGVAPNNQLVVSVNDSPDITLTFSDPTAFGLTPATVVSQVNKQLQALGITSAVAETVGDDKWQLRTVGAGDFESILVSSATSANVADAFGFGLGKTYDGVSNYGQYAVLVPATALPNPNDNLAELAVEQDTIRAFFYTGSGAGVLEALRTQSFLRRGSVEVPAVTAPGTANLSTSFPFFSGQVLWISVDGGETQVVAIPATVVNSTQLLALLNGTSGFAGVTASLSASNGLRFTHDVGGVTRTIAVLTPDTNSALGLLGISAQSVAGVSIAAIDDGNGDATTPLLQFAGADFTAAPGSATLTAAAIPNFAAIEDGMTLVVSDGGNPQTITFDGTEATVAALGTKVVAIMGATAGGTLSVSDVGGRLSFTSSRLGAESYIEIVGGTALPYLDQGTTSAATLEGTVDLSADSAAATTEGTVTLLTAQAAAAGQTFDITIDGVGPTTVSLGAAGADHTNVSTFLAHLNGEMTGATATQGPRGGIVITSDTTGASSALVLVDNAGGLAALGLVAATYAGADVFPTLTTETFGVIVDGGAEVTVSLASETSFATLKTNIEAQLTGVTASQGPSGGLVLTGSTTGTLGTIEFVDDGGGALVLLGLSEGVWAGGGETLNIGASASGAPFRPVPGDELWIDGLFYANISRVAPGGISDVLRVDKQVPIASNVGTNWYVVAKNLSSGDAATGVTRPTPDFDVELNGTLRVKHLQLRDTRGLPISGRAPIYVAYTAVRQDVSPLARNPGLLVFDGTTSLEESLSPISTDNPLALGLFFALISAPGVQVTGLGVDAVSADAPYGTVEAFTRAAEYLEGFEVYAIAPLTHDQLVAQVFSTHVSFMSDPASKGERIVLINPEVPVRGVDTLVASGTSGDGLSTVTFDTKVVNLSALLTNAGVNPTGTIPTNVGVFLDISSDGRQYSVESVTGGVVSLRTVFAAGDNEDGFYSTVPLTLPLIREAFAIRVRGGELTTPTGQRDKNATAVAVANTGRSFLNRRVWMTFPDQAATTLDGLEQRIEGFYMNAGIAGMIAQQPPQQSFTNFPMSGYTRVIGSNDTFSDRQLNSMAAGGAYIIVQEGAGAALSARMALTTDMGSVEKRTDSITKVVDFTAKFMRRGLRNFIGRFNITQGFLDTLSTVTEGMSSFLIETGVLAGATLNNIVQDEQARDTVLIDVTLDPPYPCNYIRLTLVV